MRYSPVIVAAAVSILLSLTDGHADLNSGVVEPYRETRDPKQAVFSVELHVSYNGEEIRKGKTYFSRNTAPGSITRGGVGMGDGPDGTWGRQFLDISTRDDGIYVRFSDSAGQRGTTHRKIEKRLHLPWTQMLLEEVDGLYSFSVAVHWKLK